jgi:hypothetical protein
MIAAVGRRDILAGMGASVVLAGLTGCARDPKSAILPFSAPRASVDRITAITVCTRPFRAAGPRLEIEQIGRQTIVHNYGHGGSGWSLSWGSGAIASEMAVRTSERKIAVIGCGALGLTTALCLQRAGAEVTIYAKELPPQVRSSLASGVWTPDSRICLEQNATPSFKQQWETMCRTSFSTYQSFLGLAGTPVEYIDNYFVGDEPSAVRAAPEPSDGRPAFAELQHELVPDLLPQAREFPPGTHQLGAHYLKRGSMMMFNISGYSRLLLEEFHSNGGKILITEFHQPGDLARLPHQTIVNCTGYGARALFGDDSVIPVRGQLARMSPDPLITYGLFYHRVSFLPRRDGLVFQAVGDDDYYGFNDSATRPDRKEAERAVTTIAELFPANQK